MLEEVLPGHSIFLMLPGNRYRVAVMAVGLFSSLLWPDVGTQHRRRTRAAGK